MKKILYLSMIFWWCTACSDSGVEPAEVTMEVRNYAEQKMYTFGYEQGIYLWSAKKWADKGESHVRYIVDESLLDAHNQKNNQQLKLLPESCYQIEELDFVLTDDDKIARFKVMCSPEKILELGGQTGVVEYALPVRIEVNGQRVEDRYGSTTVGILVERPYFTLTGSQEEQFDVMKVGEEIDIAFPYSINFDNRWWINLDFKVNRELVEEYNRENGTNYHVFPMEYVVWNPAECVLDRLKSDGKVVFSVKVPELEDGISLLPIELAGASEGAMVNPEGNRKYCFFQFSKTIPQTSWKVETCKTWYGNGNTLIDEVTSSDYHYNSWVVDGPAPEYYIIYSLKDMTKTADVTGLRMHCFNKLGQREADVFVSMDGANWDKIANYQFVVENGSMKPVQKLTLEQSVSARYVKIILNRQTAYDYPYSGFTEIYVNGSIKE